MKISEKSLIKMIKEELSIALREQTDPEISNLEDRIEKFSQDLVDIRGSFEELRSEKEEEEKLQQIKQQADDLVSGLDDALSEAEFLETIKKIKGKYVVYPKKGGKRLGTHSTKKAAKKQLAAIEISKQRS